MYVLQVGYLSVSALVSDKSDESSEVRPDQPRLFRARYLLSLPLQQGLASVTKYLGRYPLSWARVTALSCLPNPYRPFPPVNPQLINGSI